MQQPVMHAQAALFYISLLPGTLSHTQLNPHARALLIILIVQSNLLVSLAGLLVTVLTPSGSDLVVVHQGESVNLTCHVDNMLEAKYEWMELTESAVISMDSVLTITYTNASSVSQGGYYWCIATNMAENNNVANISNVVLVVFAPSFIEHPQPMQTTRGGSAVFICSAVGFPEPAVEWRRLTNNANTTPSDTLPSSSEISYDDDSNSTSTLTITSVGFDDFGYYICVTVAPLSLPSFSSSSFDSGSGSGLNISTLTPVLSSGLVVSSLENLTTSSNVILLTGKV